MNLFTVYILTCADGSYYVGMTSDIDRRLAEHNEGFYPNAYTFRRRPVILSFHYDCININEALAFEKQLKGWRREKKKALIEGRWDDLPELAMAYRDKTPLREPQGSFVNNDESQGSFGNNDESQGEPQGSFVNNDESQGSFGNNSESNLEPQGSFVNNSESHQEPQGSFGKNDESHQEPQGSFVKNHVSNPEPQGGFDDNDESGQASRGNFGNTDESFQEPQG